MPQPKLGRLQAISLKVNISFKYTNKQTLLRVWEGEVALLVPGPVDSAIRALPGPPQCWALE